MAVLLYNSDTSGPYVFTITPVLIDGLCYELICAATVRLFRAVTGRLSFVSQAKHVALVCDVTRVPSEIHSYVT